MSCIARQRAGSACGVVDKVSLNAGFDPALRDCSAKVARDRSLSM
jgi:hypothetical protein